MDILAQSLQEKEVQFCINELNNMFHSLCAPFNVNVPAIDIGSLYNNLATYSNTLIRNVLKNLFEHMDMEFRNSKGRTSRYYVKNTRYRTIVTIFGDVTYKRTEYIDRDTLEPYIPVDEKLNLFRRQRFDHSVASLAASMYADQNSMIKVGKLLGRFIKGFSLDYDDRDNIPRQTIFNMIHRYNLKADKLEKKEDTVETLYVMADEKFVSRQDKKDHNDEMPRSIMIKEAVIFEGISPVKDKNGNPLKRNIINEKVVVTSIGDNIWDKVLSAIDEKYDVTNEKIKNIYVLGDGASWIRSGVNALKVCANKTAYANDKFHMVKAVNSISRDDDIKQLLYSYIFNDSKKDFIEYTSALCEGDEIKIKNANYIIKQWPGIQVMYKQLSTGCAMEQTISHNLASVFSSVPKAYGNHWLPIYLNNRELYLNGNNLVKKYYQAINDYKYVEDKYADIDSLFESTKDNSQYRILNNRIRRMTRRL